MCFLQKRCLHYFLGELMRNIILVDRGHDLKFLSEALIRSYHVAVLVVDSDKIAQEAREKYKNHPQITHILSMQDLEYVDGTPYLDYKLLKIYKDVQYKIEFVNHRWLNDGMLSSNKFINALCWWNHVFDTFDISLVVSPHIEHGVTYDIPIHIAKYRHIPCFIAPPRLVYGQSILHYNTGIYIPFVSGGLPRQAFENNLFYSFNPDEVVVSSHGLSLWKQQKAIILKILLKLGGQVLVDFVLCLCRMDFHIKQHTGNFPVSFWHRLSDFFYVKKMKKFYDTHLSCIDINSGEKFIFYAMHFEPEGGTSVCVPMQNQLTVIQMLHNTLPKGWKLYIKEHPHQFNLNNPEMVYFLYNLRWWKSIEFYKEVLKLRDVVFIDHSISSQLLLQKAQATATINGTIYLEALSYNKPCIVFGGDSLLLKNAKNTIYVDSFATLQKGIDRLVKDPDSFDISYEIENYISFMCHHATNYNSPTIAQDIFASIECYLGWQNPKNN